VVEAAARIVTTAKERLPRFGIQILRVSPSPIPVREADARVDRLEFLLQPQEEPAMPWKKLRPAVDAEPTIFVEGPIDLKPIQIPQVVERVAQPVEFQGSQVQKVFATVHSDLLVVSGGKSCDVSLCGFKERRLFRGVRVGLELIGVADSEERGLPSVDRDCFQIPDLSVLNGMATDFATFRGRA
jgi:hypothetical protein